MNLSELKLSELSKLNLKKINGGIDGDDVLEGIGYAWGFAAGVVTAIYEGAYEMGHDLAENNCDC